MTVVSKFIPAIGGPIAITVPVAGVHVVGTANPDLLTGGGGPDLIEGLGGDDVLNGGSGVDNLQGGDGDDVLNGGTSGDILNGGPGSDTATYVNATALVKASLLNPAINTGEAAGDSYVGIENLTGSKFNDSLFGDAQDNILEGGLGADILSGGAGSDWASYAHASAGLIVNLTTPAFNTGEAFGDTFSAVENLIGSAFNDSLIGTGGNNIIMGGAGSDTMDGGAGLDIVSYASAKSGVVVNIATPFQNTGDAYGDTADHFEVLEGSNFDDVLTAGGTVTGLSGLGGDDVLEGRFGANALNGGSGVDTASYAHAAAGVTANMTSPGLNAGEATGDSYISIENLLGSAFADSLTGNGGDNVLTGGLGGDALNGAGGTDTASYAKAASGVTAFLAAAILNGGEAAGDSYTSIENLLGSAFGDHLVGDSGDNRLDGGLGDDQLVDGFGADVLVGGEGDDTLTGGAGADVLDGGAGNDTASYFNSAEGVMVSLTSAAYGTGDAKNDVLIGIENLSGTNYNDQLVGDAGTNRLTGGLGRDFLQGGGGADIFDGGADDDMVLYTDAAGSVTVNLSNPGANTGEAADDTFIGIESAQGGAFNDHLTGDGGVNSLFGSGGDDLVEGLAGNDYLFGEAGNDRLVGGLGNDLLAGGTGIDTADYSAATGPVIVVLSKPDPVTGPLIIAPPSDGGGGDGQGPVIIDVGPDPDHGSSSGAEGVDDLTSIENVIGSAFDDQLSGQGDVANTIDGRGGNDILKGDGGDDTLIGGLGGDVLDGGTGGDLASYRDAATAVTASLAGAAGNTGEAAGDSYVSIEGLIGSAFADTLTGDAGVNILIGNAGADKLTGNAGDDLLVGGAGADQLFGGAGIDTAAYVDSTSGVVANMTLPATNTGDAAGDTYNLIENLAGSAFADTLTGNALANTLNGLSGNDTLNGMNGVDVLIGGIGSDVLDGGAGIDTASYLTALVGVAASLQDASINTGDALGDSYIAIENLEGSGFGDTLSGDGAANTVSGLGGDDVLIGGAGADVLDGGLGLDTASYRNAATAVSVSLLTPASNSGEAVGDSYLSVENLEGSGFGDVLTGDGGANTLSGLAGDDTLHGGAGSDVLVGGVGGDSLDGGLGLDLASYETALAGVIASLQTPASNSGDAVGDTYMAVEGLRGSLFADILVGDAGDNWLQGLAGGDALNGLDGNDVLEGGEGGDVLAGGNGVDTASYANAKSSIALVGTPDGVRANLTDASLNLGEAAGDVYLFIENLSGSAWYDELTGDGASNRLSGMAGGDDLRGLAGDDVLDGGGGADKLDGGLGSDTATYEFATAGVIANLAAPAGNSGEAAGDTYVSIENLTGSAFNDTLWGDAGGNLLMGGAGADKLFGQNGDDLLVGGVGADTLNGGLGTDTASYGWATAGVTANLTSSALNLGEAAGDTYASIENLTGSNFDDRLLGTATANTLEGGGGSDELWGMAGADSFIFRQGFGQDVVKDFTAGSAVGHDVLAFDSSLFANFAAVMAHASQVGSSVVITYDAGDTVTLANVTLGSLVAADMFFF
jgi:Ca2+-binding RTX toxin-like protein